jgi:hypothetical protein
MNKKYTILSTLRIVKWIFGEGFLKKSSVHFTAEQALEALEHTY